MGGGLATILAVVWTLEGVGVLVQNLAGDGVWQVHPLCSCTQSPQLQRNSVHVTVTLTSCPALVWVRRCKEPKSQCAEINYFSVLPLEETQLCSSCGFFVALEFLASSRSTESKLNWY